MEPARLAIAASLLFVATLYPESRIRFFAMDRDLRFEFESGEDGKMHALTVYENGTVSKRAQRAE